MYTCVYACARLRERARDWNVRTLRRAHPNKK